MVSRTVSASATIFFSFVALSAATEDKQSCGVEGSCPAAKSAAMMQLTAIDKKGQAFENDVRGSAGAINVGQRIVSFEASRGRASAAYISFLRRKVVSAQLSAGPAVTELEDLVGTFIAHQSNSEDKCSSQLLEAKHQLNQLHVTINDLAAEINSTQTSIQVLTIQLTTAREEEQKVEEWKIEELHKCEVIREERRKMLYTLQQELIEMHHIARPDVTMDIAGGTVSTGVSLMEEAAAPAPASPLSAAQTLVAKTKDAAATLMSCVKASAPEANSDAQSTTEAPGSSEQCTAQKEVLEETYVKTYVELTRLVAEYEELIKSTSCEDTVHQEYNVKITPIRKEISELVIRIEALETKLEELRPRLVDAYNAEKSLRVQITQLTTQCKLLPETVTDLDKIRDAIHAMDKCPGLGAAEFNIPIWTKEWVEVSQKSDENDESFDARMDEACATKFAGSGDHPVRAAEVSEIMAVAIEGMPTSNTANGAIVGACPLCAGEADADTGLTHADSHARICWDTGVVLSGATMRKDCSNGLRAVLCVYDRGDIREQTREDLSSTSTESGDTA